MCVTKASRKREDNSMSGEEPLFSQGNLTSVLEHQRRKMREEVEQYDGNKLLNSSVGDLAAYFVEKHRVEPLSLQEHGISVDQAETRIDVTNRFEYGGFGDRPIIVPGTRISFHIPYSGDQELLKFRPDSFLSMAPRAKVTSSELIFSYASPDLDALIARKHFDQDMDSLRRYIGWAARQVESFNASLVSSARETIESRRERLLRNQNIAASLGFPLRTKPEAQRTFSLPDIRRRAAPAPPPASSAPYAPEPALDDATYEHILGVLGNMVRVMEQSPEAFSEMSEPDLRTHFLVQLNGQFEGRASGETFRGSGRTDILIEERDRSVFIAECKFWDGPKSLVGALDQLLDYATWRDAKAAVLIFSRNADFSAVVQQAMPALADHPQRRGEVHVERETTFRLRLRQREDSAREIVVTVMVFNVPTNRATSDRLQQRKGRSKAS
jgi:hypothetical protein